MCVERHLNTHVDCFQHGSLKKVVFSKYIENALLSNRAINADFLEDSIFYNCIANVLP